jgi:hypothetical protein
MAYVPTIYDWRRNCAPIDQVFRAGGTSIQAGLTTGGASVESPEPGGRFELFMNFAPFATEEANLDASWTISRILNGNVMRIGLYNTVQLVKASAITAADVDNGIPWSNSQPWATDENWAWSPSSPIAAAALKGASTFTANLAGVGEILKIGHVIGFYVGGFSFAHMVMDIAYDAADVATVTVEPPLRRALTTSNTMLYRPTAMVTCRNAREVMSNFTSGRHMAFNTARFAEAIV